MLDLFLKIIAKCFELAKYKKNNKKAVFQEIIAPLYKDMIPVVEDYFSLFRSVNDAVREDDKSEFDLLKKEIKNRREKMLHIRIQIRAMANVLKSMDDSDIQVFAKDILQLFEAPIVNGERSIHAEGLDYHLKNVVEPEVGVEPVRHSRLGTYTYWLEDVAFERIMMGPSA